MIRSLLYLFTFFVTILITQSPALAARPFATDDAGTVTKGAFELESGFDFWKNSLSTGFCLTHGLTERMDIGIGFGYNPLPEEERQFSGAEIGIKFGLIPDLLAVTSTGSFGDKKFCLNCILTKYFRHFGIDANLGMEAIADTNDADLTYGLCCHFDAERFGAGCEICGTHEGFTMWQIGCNCGVCDWLCIDAGFNGDFNKKISLCATAGLTFSFPVSRKIEQGE